MGQFPQLFPQNNMPETKARRVSVCASYVGTEQVSKRLLITMLNVFKFKLTLIIVMYLGKYFHNKRSPQKYSKQSTLSSCKFLYSCVGTAIGNIEWLFDKNMQLIAVLDYRLNRKQSRAMAYAPYSPMKSMWFRLHLCFKENDK